MELLKQNKISMQKVKPVFLFLILAFVLTALVPPPPKENGTRWISLEQAELNNRKEKRPILIDLYTDWCGWCGVMDKKTYGNKKVAAYLESKFYPVKINAETRQTIIWNNRSFAYNPSYRTNDFALFLTGGNLSYPSTVIIPEEGASPQVIPGYLKPAEFEIILKYFGEGHHRSVSFDLFHKKFKSDL